MKKYIFTFYFFIMANLSYAQMPTNIYINGYKAIFIPSDTFYVHVKNPSLGTKKIDEKSLELEIVDKNGRMPKDTVYIYTNNIDFIYAQNSQLYFEDKFKIDSLKISGVCSFGEIDVACKKLTISLAAGGSLTAKGSVESLVCNVKAASSFYSDQLISEKAELNVSNKSHLTVNAKNIINLVKSDDSLFSNVND